MASDLSLSIVIPAYNEADRLPRTLAMLEEWRRGWPSALELIIVDDGSTDGTSRCVIPENLQGRVISLETNQGKGAAVRTGILAASGDWILMMDADGATPMTEFDRLWQTAEKTHNAVIIGSRAKPGGDTRVVGMLHRKVMGRLFTLLIQPLLPGIYDSQCGFKLFPADVGKKLAQKLTINGFGFDVELLTIARANGIPIVEIPINWQDKPYSRVKVIRDGGLMVLSLFKIAWLRATGHYHI
jgi:dolichyl-phosphate beta-glucosyltransferase